MHKRQARNPFFAPAVLAWLNISLPTQSATMTHLGVRGGEADRGMPRPPPLLAGSGPSSRLSAFSLRRLATAAGSMSMRTTPGSVLQSTSVGLPAQTCSSSGGKTLRLFAARQVHAQLAAAVVPVGVRGRSCLQRSTPAKRLTARTHLHQAVVALLPVLRRQ